MQWFLAIVLVTGILLCSLTPVFAAGTIKIIIDGQEVPSDVQPKVVQERTMVPIRVVSEYLGKNVQWDQDNWRVLIGDFQAVPPGKGHVPGAPIRIYVDGVEMKSDVPPTVVQQRTLVPLRAIGEALGMNVDWDQKKQQVIINSPGYHPGDTPDDDIWDPQLTSISIMGEPVASSDQLRTLLKNNNPAAPDLVELYLNIGRMYGIRGDIAFCQAAKETGWWRFTGDVKPEQNNYCGLYATGSSLTGNEPLRGADPARVWFEAGQHGASFDSPATGVEAHIQHLYAYATNKPLPAYQTLVDPRFNLVQRGSATQWVELGGKWAPAQSYGYSILKDYYCQVGAECVQIPILGESEASAAQLRTLLRKNNPMAPDLVDLYLDIGRIYGVRGDIAFCQAAKETGWWRYGGLVKPEQNNYCGLSATGRAAEEDEDLRGADPTLVWFIPGAHGAFFASPAVGVEAHIQHLYAYASTQPLPENRTLVDPRFAMVKRGSAISWTDLGGKWAVPGFDKNKYATFEDAYRAGETYGHSILNDYYYKAVQ